MQRTLEIMQDAEAEVAAARDWYASQSPNAVEAFIKALDVAIAEVVAHPER